MPAKGEGKSADRHRAHLLWLQLRLLLLLRQAFNGQAFLQACRRRVYTLLEMYGDKEDGTAIAFSHTETDPYARLSISRALRWVDFKHYSGRQDATMMLGGTMGTFNLEGTAPSTSWDALDFCATVGTGKNTSFGFGTIQVEYDPVSGGPANG